MAKVIMIQGTTSNAGKSLLTAGFCRVFAQDGYKVAPFKSQNMALNSFITKDGLEMGRAQVVQAEASYKAPDVRMNPILLKPTSDKGSQVVVNGEVIGNMGAMEYYNTKDRYIPAIMEAYNSLSAENDIIVIEGAGSPAEINLKENDIVNMGMAKMAKSPVLIVGDIDRGGVFASLYGTYMLQSEEEKRYIKGNIINKFRGDIAILTPGIKMLEALIPVEVIGCLPYIPLQIDDEDSLSDVFENRFATGVLDIAVIRLPRISNFTDFNSFEVLLKEKVRYVTNVEELKNPDMIILPGTKNTMGDLKWLKEKGLDKAIVRCANGGTIVFGICGGYQMLCKTLKDPYSVEEGGEATGLGLLDAHTVFNKEKTRTRVQGTIGDIEGDLQGLTGAVFEGYEIHMGETTGKERQLSTLQSEITTKADGMNKNNVYGSYVHGIFDSEDLIYKLQAILYAKKGIKAQEGDKTTIKQHKENEYNKLADAVRNYIDIKKVYEIIEKGID